MTNEQLIIRIRAGEQTAANMLQLWQQDKAFVSKLARRYAGCAEMDDLKAIRKLGAPHTSRKYRSYWEEYRTPYPIWHIGIESFQRTGYSEVERAVLGWDS